MLHGLQVSSKYLITDLKIIFLLVSDYCEFNKTWGTSLWYFQDSLWLCPYLMRIWINLVIPNQNCRSHVSGSCVPVYTLRTHSLSISSRWWKDKTYIKSTGGHNCDLNTGSLHQAWLQRLCMCYGDTSGFPWLGFWFILILVQLQLGLEHCICVSFHFDFLLRDSWSQ